MDGSNIEDHKVDDQDLLTTSSTTKLPIQDQKVEPKTETDDNNIPVSEATLGRQPSEPVHPLVQWREVLRDQPEWPSLPGATQLAVQMRLKSTSFPTEPSGHNSWKHVRSRLREGRQPDMVNLITATFIWRVKQKRKRPNLIITSLPDSFVHEATFHNPQVDIWSWPRRDGVVAPWVGQGMREATADHRYGGAADPLARASDVVRGCPSETTTAAPAASHGIAAPAATARAIPDGGATGTKRGRARDDEDEPIARPPPKRPGATGRPAPAPAAPAAPHRASASRVEDWRMRFAAADANLAAANMEIASLTLNLSDTTSELADVRARLEEATGRLDGLAAEVGEVRAIAVSERRNVRKFVAVVGEATRAQQQSLGELGKELKKLEENMC